MTRGFPESARCLPAKFRDYANDYSPGDLVTWDLGHGLIHIGMVVERTTLFSGRHLIEHNIGAGPKIEDVLFGWKITGHYRYFGPPVHGNAAQSATK